MLQPDAPLTPEPGPMHDARVPQPAHSVMLGPLGLRAGWGILLFFVFSLVLGFMLLTGLFAVTGLAKVYRADTLQALQAKGAAAMAHQPAPVQPTRLSTALVAEAAQAGAVLLAAFLLSFVERRRFGVYGMRSRFVADIVPGAVCGLVAISLLVGLLRALHLLVFDAQLEHGARAVWLGAGWLLMFLMVGLFEEFLFRGYIQFTLTRGLLGLGEKLSPGHARRTAFWLTALVWSLLFSATHLANAGEDPFGIVMVFLAGVVFSYALWRTGSLWWAIGFHMTWDWGQSFLWGVPDSGTISMGRLFQTHAVGRTLLSGGGTGPEGSVYVVPVLLLSMLAVRLMPQREQPAVEPEGSAVVPHEAAVRPIP